MKDSHDLARPQLNSDKRIRVLIGFAEALSSPEVTWSLIGAGFEVCAIARRGRNCALRHSRHVSIFEITGPEISCSNAKTEFIELLDRLQSGTLQSVFLPLDDAAIWLYNQIDPRPNWVSAGPDKRGSHLALDKWQQIKIAKEAGFSVPPSALALCKDDLRDCVLKFPLIIRPAQAVSVVGDRLKKGANWICKDRDEMELATRSWNGSDPLLVQEFIDGRGEGLFGLSHEGLGHFWSAHRRLRMMNPHGSGSSACISQVADSKVINSAGVYLKSSGWNGLFMIELLKEQSGCAWFVEFNGRPWGSMALARRMGYEYPAWAVQCALNGEISEKQPNRSKQEGVICRNIGRELMHLLFVYKGPKSKAIKHWPSRFGTTIDLLRFEKGTTIYNWCASDWRVFFYDCFYTVIGNLRKSRD